MAWRRIALLVLLVAVAGCGAVPDPPPQPTPPPEARITDNQGELKAASWRAAAAAEARRLALLRAAIRKARKSTSVAGALRLALLTERISPATHARLSREYLEARKAAARLTGTRSSELWSVIGVVDSLAAAHLLDAGRLRPSFLVLERNTEFWTHNAFPYASQRITFGRDPAVFQYYPGRGMQLQPLASWGKVNWLAGECLRARAKARRRGACPVADLRRTVDRLLSLAAPRARSLSCVAPSTACSAWPPAAATSSPGSTTSAGAAGHRRGSAA